ncbi:hypothetical protein ABZX75_33295 [Streptomyces sp. NPDC003038]
MWAEIRELSIAVVDHPHWKSLPVDVLVAARMQLRRQARPAEMAEAA